ncbi:MAG: cell division protein FtsZ, partial [Pseudomonadota bacterium]
MPINLSMPETHELKPRITVVGVGGAGGNAVNNMIEAELEGVEFVAANTDAQAITLSKASRKIQMGSAITEGLGAGMQPDIGRAAAEESIEEITEQLAGSHMVFITAGMGGGTGTGAAPVIARAARDQNMLTVGVVTKPFQFEGSRRMRIAEAGIEELQRYVDTLLIIPNQNLFRIANERTTFAEAFTMADQVLHSGVRGITDLMVMPGLINLDFADVRTVMNEMGKAMMGTGEAEGEKRAVESAEAAISNPLLDEVSMKGARGVLINITGGMDMTLFEVDEAANRIRSEVDPDANIIVGSTFDEAMEGKIRVSVVATGIEASVPMHHGGDHQSAAQTGGDGAGQQPAPWRQPAPAPAADGAVQADVSEPGAAAAVSPAPAQASAVACAQAAPAPTTSALPEQPKPSVPLPSPAVNPVGHVQDQIRRRLDSSAQERAPKLEQSSPA